ncbi:MAG: choice-of-anchor E domain-containing protein [Methanothrix sp.]|nr:choice-of-anchor E domain-containing protein [Methanothrix sp.]
MKLLRDTLCRTLIFTVFISLWLLSASADRIEFCDSIPEEMVNWDSSVTFPKFDPQLGTLKAADLFCKTNLSQKINLENMDAMPANFNMSISGSLMVKLPSENLSVSFNNNAEGNLSEYDGSEDYSGASGISSVIEIPTEARSMSLSNLEDLVAGSSGESITLPVKVESSFQMKLPVAASSSVSTRAGAQVCISYTYDAVSAKEGANDDQ